MTQKSGSQSDGKSTAETKLVEWPVEDRVPARSDVLYRGHSYICWGPSGSWSAVGMLGWFSVDLSEVLGETKVYKRT